MSAEDCVPLGIAGLGGYANSIRQTIEKAELDPTFGSPGVKLHAVCEPFQAPHAELIDKLKARGVQVFNDLDGLLRSDIQAVWLPVPIDLHRPFTEKSLAAGKPVMCEKPAAGCIEDLDAMIGARDQSKLPVAIGFQHIYDPQILELKSRLLAGEIGRIQSATLYACWPRGDQYYQRASWAGAMKRNGVWVLDSPANNALAHYINLGLFLLSSQPDTSVSPQMVEAELYRTRPIENYDTCSMRLHLPGGIPFLVMFTHACVQNINPILALHGEQGTVQWQGLSRVCLTDRTGQVRWESRSESERMHLAMVRRFINAVRGIQANPGPLATLEMARHHLIAINGASEVAKVHTINDNFIRPTASNSGTLTAIADIESIFATCAQKQQMIHESAMVKWSVPASRCDLKNYRSFAGPAL